VPRVRVTLLRDGEPVRGHRVVLEFDHGLSDAHYTDSDGIAEFNVKYGQQGNVLVDGRKVDRWGSYSATDITVQL